MANVNQEAFKVYLDRDDAAELRGIAQAEDRSVTSLFRQAVRDLLAKKREG